MVLNVNANVNANANENTRVPRMALMMLLDERINAKVLYLHAPAGYGKTVSAQLWLEHLDMQAGFPNTKRAIISLDEYDNSSPEFCWRFISALSSIEPHNDTLKLLLANQTFSMAPFEFAFRSIAALSDGQTQCFIVIDDLHIIYNVDILKILPNFINRLPLNYTVIILSREAFPESFADMELKGELFVVGPGHLKFTKEEIEYLFHINGHDISNEQAEEILDITGGWPIGIRALLFSNELSYKQKLKEQYIDRYFKTHIWKKWDERTKRFMAFVSVVDELTPELCYWLTKGVDGGKCGGVGKDVREGIGVGVGEGIGEGVREGVREGVGEGVREGIGKNVSKDVSEGEAASETLSSCEEILETLAYEDAFLRSTGEGTYRFHDLFRSFLMKTLAEYGNEVETGQWNRAGDYYYEKENYYRAIEYYKKGKNDDGIEKSFNFGINNYNKSTASINDILSIVHLSLSDSIQKKHPSLYEIIVWRYFAEGHADEYEIHADEYYQLKNDIFKDDVRWLARYALMGFIDYRQSAQNVFEMIARLPFDEEVINATPTLTHNLPFFHRSNRDFSEFLFDLDKNITMAEKSIGVIIGNSITIMNMSMHSGFLYERGSLHEANSHALETCSLINDSFTPEIRFCAMMILAAILVAMDQEDEAKRVMDDIDAMIERNNAYYLTPNFRAFKYRLSMSDGDEPTAQESAQDWLSNYNRDLHDTLTFYEIYQHFTTARAFITTENYSEAIIILQKLLRLSTRYRRPLDIIESHILLAISYWKKGRGGRDAAMDHIEKAVAISHKYGYSQIFVNESDDLVNMLHRLHKRTVQKNYSGEIPNNFAKALYTSVYEKSSLRNKLTVKGRKTPRKLSFTEKQKTIMQLLVDGYNRNGIAEKLGIRPNTVKSHLDLIKQKLDVISLTEAVVKIKRLRILDETDDIN